MQTNPDAMTWMEQQTADLPERGGTELALRILNQIEAEMKRQGVSRSELARRAGRKPSYVSRILNDPGNVTLATIVRLANALDLEAEPPRLRPRRSSRRRSRVGGRRGW